MIGQCLATLLVVALAVQHVRMADKINNRITRGPASFWIADSVITLAAVIFIIWKIWR